MAKFLTLGPGGERFQLPDSTNVDRFLGDAYGPTPFTITAKNAAGFDVRIYINPPQISWLAVQDD